MLKIQRVTAFNLITFPPIDALLKTEKMQFRANKLIQKNVTEKNPIMDKKVKEKKDLG